MNDERKDSSDRGNAYYCKVCLDTVGNQHCRKKKLTCKQTLKAYRTNSWLLQGKRKWWQNLERERPKHFQAFLQNTGWKAVEVDKLFHHLLGPCKDFLLLEGTEGNE